MKGEADGLRFWLSQAVGEDQGGEAHVLPTPFENVHISRLNESPQHREESGSRRLESDLLMRTVLMGPGGHGSIRARNVFRRNLSPDGAWTPSAREVNATADQRFGSWSPVKSDRDSPVMATKSGSSIVSNRRMLSPGIPFPTYPSNLGS